MQNDDDDDKDMADGESLQPEETNDHIMQNGNHDHVEDESMMVDMTDQV